MWEYDGQNYHGCPADGPGSEHPWCYTEPSSSDAWWERLTGYRYDYCSPFAGGYSLNPETPRQTVEGCKCMRTWRYHGHTVNTYCQRGRPRY